MASFCAKCGSPVNEGAAFCTKCEAANVPQAAAALVPPPVPGGPPMNPVAATGNQAHDWALKYERTVGGPEADLVVRTGDINNSVLAGQGDLIHFPVNPRRFTHGQTPAILRAKNRREQTAS